MNGKQHPGSEGHSPTKQKLLIELLLYARDGTHAAHRVWGTVEKYVYTVQGKGPAPTLREDRGTGHCHTRVKSCPWGTEVCFKVAGGGKSGKREQS